LDIRVIDLRIKKTLTLGNNVRGGKDSCKMYICMKKSKGKEWSSKGRDGCPLTSPPLQRCGITTHEDLQEVTRSALVKGIESKVAVLMC
jgi:hypothetical protein